MRIKLAQLILSFDIPLVGGGITQFCLELSKQLDPEKFDITICGLGFETEASLDRITDLHKLGLQTFLATGRRYGEAYPKFKFITQASNRLAEKLSSEQFQILHSHFEITDVVAALLKLRGKVPRILRTVHTAFPLEYEASPFRRFAFTNLLYPVVFDAEVGISLARQKRLDNRWLARLTGKKSQKIYNAIPQVDTAASPGGVVTKKAELGIPVDRQVIGSVGRLAEHKGYFIFLEAAALVLKTHPELTFILVGDGPLLGDLLQYAGDLGITRNVVFTGPRQDVPELLKCMDLFVSSSFYEGIPTVILESMAAGVPVIATDIPGTDELIDNGFNGWLVPPADAHALADCLLDHLHNPTGKEKITLNAFSTLEKFSLKRIALEYEILYQELAKNR